MSITKARPGAIGETRGRKIYSLAAVIPYRKALGVIQTDVVARIHMSQAYVSMVERTNEAAIQEKTILDILDAVDAIAADRARLAAEGLAEFEALAGRKAPR